VKLNEAKVLTPKGLMKLGAGKPPVIEGVGKPPVIEGVDEFKKKKASTAIVVASTGTGIMALFVIAIIVFVVLCAIAFLWVLYHWKW
jgi:hypothetical protein